MARTSIVLAAVGSFLSLSFGAASAQPTYRLTDVGTLGPQWDCSGGAINASAKVTGTCTTRVAPRVERAFLWNGRSIRDLGSLGGRFTSGQAINASGWVAGTSLNAAGRFHAFLWDGSLHDLGTLGGRASHFRAMNDSGQVTGGADISGSAAFHAFISDGTMMQDLGTLGGSHSDGWDINAAGWVTGYASTTTPGTIFSHAFLWDGSTMHDLDTLGGTFSIGLAINDVGQIAGDSETTLPDNLNSHAFLWDGGTMQDLGTLGGGFSSAVDINASGWVIGFSSTSTHAAGYHAFVWNGAMHDLGTLGGFQSHPNAINASGQVTGQSYTANNAAEHAFVWDNGTLYDLNDLIDPTDPKRGFTLIAGHDINDLGQIVATGVYLNRTRVFVVSPTDYRILGFFMPDQAPPFKLGGTVTIKVKLVDAGNGSPIRDGEAIALLNRPCRVKFSVSGAQTRVPRCMTYDRATDKFSYDWAIGKTGSGPTTIAVDVSYSGSSTTMIRKSKNIIVTE